jgi:prevent-host-death family protein
MTSISVDEIQRNLQGFLERVKTGESLLILENGEPVAEIKPVAHSGASLRPYGLCAGEFRVPDDFDAPLPDEILEVVSF